MLCDADHLRCPQGGRSALYRNVCRFYIKHRAVNGFLIVRLDVRSAEALETCIAELTGFVSTIRFIKSRASVCATEWFLITQGERHETHVREYGEPPRPLQQGGRKKANVIRNIAWTQLCSSRLIPVENRRITYDWKELKPIQSYPWSCADLAEGWIMRTFNMQYNSRRPEQRVRNLITFDQEIEELIDRLLAVYTQLWVDLESALPHSTIQDEVNRNSRTAAVRIAEKMTFLLGLIEGLYHIRLHPSGGTIEESFMANQCVAFIQRLPERLQWRELTTSWERFYSVNPYYVGTPWANFKRGVCVSLYFWAGHVVKNRKLRTHFGRLA